MNNFITFPFLPVWFLRSMFVERKHRRIFFILCFNPLNPNINIQILICCPYMFSIEVVGEFVEVSIKFILCDPVLNSHDHCVL